MAIIDRIMYEVLYRVSKPRWDDNQIPPQVVQLVSNRGISGNAIDLGCGTGTHAIYLAQRGFTVTGIDGSKTAIRQAEEKASRAGVKPEFIVHDVTRLDFLGGPFDIALDVGCLHGLRAAEQMRYALELTRLMKPGSTLLVWGMDPQPMGPGLTPERVERIFVPGFKLERIENVQLHRRASKWYWLKRTAG
ncbi:MAG TPA: class I SAM-dependent methyltransferase [Anaerolineaceae bacterium]|nr:class I SAM-dependent methyltransferase [Anaerolineaceae bacterium]